MLKLVLSVAFIVINSSSLFAGEKLQALEREFQALVDSSKPSIVTVTSKFSNQVMVEKESGILSFFKNETELRAVTYVNIGTGIIYNQNGYIITRSSIVLGAESNKVTFADESYAAARFIGHDPETGFAILQVEKEDLRPVHFGDSETLSPGSWNFMIGNSLGVYPSVAFGAINGIREDGMLQLSTTLSPGNNGSPIINMAGEVVALVAGHLSPAADENAGFNGTGVGFATLAYPINWIRRIVDDIIEHGVVRKAWLGVVGYHDGRQPKISAIKANSPAEDAGLVVGDVIVKFSYQHVNTIDQLARLVEYSTPGTTVPLEYQRGDQFLTTEVKLGERKGRHAEMPGGGDAEASSAPIRQAVNPNAAMNAAGHDDTTLLQRIEALELELKALKQLIGKR